MASYRVQQSLLLRRLVPLPIKLIGIVTDYAYVFDREIFAKVLASHNGPIWIKLCTRHDDWFSAVCDDYLILVHVRHRADRQETFDSKVSRIMSSPNKYYRVSLIKDPMAIGFAIVDNTIPFNHLWMIIEMRSILRKITSRNHRVLGMSLEDQIMAKVDAYTEHTDMPKWQRWMWRIWWAL